MIIHLRLKAYGKINLALDVLGRCQDGCHGVRIVIQTAGLHNRADLCRTSEPDIWIETNLFYPPTDKQNLAYRAVELLIDEFYIRQGVAIHLRKLIPVSTGVAGGSTDTAPVLFGVSKMFELSLTTRDLVERGTTLGIDVPCCLVRGAALPEGIDEKLSELPPMPQCQVLIAKPGISVSTETVYKRLDVIELAPEDHPDIDGMVDAICHRNLMEVAGKFGNVLKLITGGMYPVIAKIEQVMRGCGAMDTMMSDSGLTVFGLFTNPRVAQSAYETLRFGQASELTRQIYLTDFFNMRRNQ